MMLNFDFLRHFLSHSMIVQIITFKCEHCVTIRKRHFEDNAGIPQGSVFGLLVFSFDVFMHIRCLDDVCIVQNYVRLVPQ